MRRCQGKKGPSESVKDQQRGREAVEWDMPITEFDEG